MTNIKIYIDKKEVDQQYKSYVREDQKQSGMFDGRFKTKSVKSAKEYRRKPKHKGQSYE